MFRFGDPGGRMYTTAGAANANMLSYWTSILNGSNWLVSAGNGRLGGSSLRLNSSSSGGGYALVKTLDAQATWGIAFAVRVSGLVGYALAAFRDAGTEQVGVSMNADGTLSIYRAGGPVLGTSVATLSLNAYAHLELKVKIDPSAGTVELRKNGVPIIGPLTGLNTRNTANSSANQVAIANSGGNPPGVTIDFDDVIVWDAQLTDANGLADIHDFVGDCRLMWLLPTGAGTTTQFTPDSGSNFARVNEATPDGDTSYVADANVGDIDTYAMADLPAGTPLVKSMAVCHYAKKSDAGARSIAAELRTGGVNYAYATPVFLGTSYLYDFSNWGSNPNTGVAWTPADINALETGQKVAS